MKFPWHKYIEIPLNRRNTLQVFITNKCNLLCPGCFAKSIMSNGEILFISLAEYKDAIIQAIKKGCKQINILGGEPLFHSQLLSILNINREYNLKTTIYTNGSNLSIYSKEDFDGVKIRISLYCKTAGIKSAFSLLPTNIPIEICFMVSKTTTVKELLETAGYIEENFNCDVFFISSIRELNNIEKDFFVDTDISMPVLEYKKLVHNFLWEYNGVMEIHVSKRGVFESTLGISENKCRFANYFIGGKIIQCPYDIINLKFQNDYEFGERYCQHNNSCLMSKVIYKRTK